MIGQRVKILDGMKEFVGKTGQVVDVEKDGSTKMYRVKLDKPVEIPNVGMVDNDLWAREYLKVITKGNEDSDDGPMQRCPDCNNVYRNFEALQNHFCRG